MWLPKDQEKKGARKGLVGVAIDNDKGSKYALKWAIDNLLFRGQTVVLIHVLPKPSTTSSCASPLSCSGSPNEVHSRTSTPREIDKQAKDLFLTFHCFCTRKDVQCIDVILEDKNIVKALVEYANHAAIENLVLGASRHGFIRRLKGSDIPSYVSKGAPEFCTVYVISKGKISSVRNASRSAPFASPLNDRIAENNSRVSRTASSARSKPSFRIRAPDRTPHRLQYISDDMESIKSPFARGKGNGSDRKLFGDIPESQSDLDLSFVSSSGDRPSVDRLSVSHYNYNNNGCRISTCSSSENSLGSLRYGAMYSDTSSISGFSPSGLGSGANSSSSQEQLQDEVEAEMRRLKLELKQTMDLYSTACREALSAKQKAVELHHWRVEEERRLEEARVAEEAAKAIAEREKAKCRAAIESAEAAHRIAQLEAQRRISAEMIILKESQESTDTFKNENSMLYRKYTIEEIETATEYFAESRKIGEGGYGPVYRCYLDHTPVAVKVLRPDAAQGREQFQKEVEILSCMRHPNMVLLLGACPEYGCLVYEYMGNGSLDDRIFRRDNTPPLSWQLRFRIAAEIATGLLFLHQTKPEPLVHRDLKPANILLDHNFVSKISDVGLARLVPPSLDDGVTQFRMTSTAGTFCYIDPEYQQTGMLGVKSDIYSLGVVLLQLITAKPAMALAHHVGRSIEKGKEAFHQMLDQSVGDWPVDEALSLAKIAVQCAELRRRDRPDLAKEVMPQLNRLKQLAATAPQNSNLNHFTPPVAADDDHVSITQDVMSDPLPESCEISSKSHSGSSATE